jgi:hypothetical protein
VALTAACASCDCPELVGEPGARFCARCGHPVGLHHAAASVTAPPPAVEYGLAVSELEKQAAAATAPVAEYGLRVRPPTAQIAADPVPGVAPPPIAAVQQAPATARRARRQTRSVPRPAVAAAALFVVAIAAAAVYLTTRSTHSHAATRPAPVVPTSPRPPSFAPVVSVTAHAASRPGLVATPAHDGGLWYQSPTGNLTRLATADGGIAYAFATHQPARGLVISSHTLIVVTADAVIERDRGNGRLRQTLPLPAPPGCCPPIESGASIWITLRTGLARLNLADGQITEQPTARAATGLAVAGSRVWLMTANQLSAVDPVTGKPGAPRALRGFTADAIAAGAGAVWAIGSRHGQPQLLRLDDHSGRPQLSVPLPAAATAVAVEDGAVWLAMPGVGVQEFDPSTNRLVGTPVAIAHPTALLAAGNDRLWVMGTTRAGRATFTRLELHPSRG